MKSCTDLSLLLAVINRKGSVLVIVVLDRAGEAVIDQEFPTDIAGDVVAERPIEIGFILTEAEVIVLCRRLQTLDEIIHDVSSSVFLGLVLFDHELDNVKARLQLEIMVLGATEALRQILGLVIDAKPTVFDLHLLDFEVLCMVIAVKEDRPGNFYDGTRILQAADNIRSLHKQFPFQRCNQPVE